MPPLPSFPIHTLAVRPRPDALIDEIGYDVRSAYVERFWLGILGPSATWLIRRLADGLDQSPDGYDLDLPRLAAEIGLGTRSGQHSPFIRTLERCARFGVVELVGQELRVRRHLPPLTRFQLERLPAPLREEHPAWLEGARPHPSVGELREHARGLALSLLELGEDEPTTERLLHRREVHPALAHEAVAWAVAHRQSSGPERTSWATSVPGQNSSG